MTEKERKQLYFIAIVLAIAAPGYLLMNWRPPKEADYIRLTEELDSLRTVVEESKAILSEGSIASVEQLAEDYSARLTLMRDLVPMANEVVNFIDDIVARADLRGVTVNEWDPLAPEDTVPFQVYRYQFSVSGRYDQVGEFLADIASLPRIMVPYELTLAPTRASTEAADEGIIDASFQIRTYVKQPEGVSGGSP